MPAYMHYDANYLLIVDNLSDFAHLAFVHTKTLGGSEEYAYHDASRSPSSGWRDGFRVERWHMNSDPPPFHKKVIPRQGREGRPPQHRPHARARHLLYGVAVCAGRQRRRDGQPKAPASTATASS